MGRIKDMTGMRFGKLTVIEFAGLNKEKKATWLCKCDCGNETIAVGKHLREGRKKSCGCLFKENHHSTHSMTHTRPYKIWCGMKTRCDNSKREHYDNYGGRGITYDPKWETFEGFWNDMEEGYTDNLTLDRIDVNEGYNKDNCRWVTMEVQSNNKRNTVYITYNGVTKTRSEWCKELNLNYQTVRYRQEQGWSAGEILGLE